MVSYICCMKIFVIILTLIMTFKPVLPLVDYAVNYDYISEVLCINKDKPELKCNGKCHLQNELAKASDDSSEQNNQENNLKISQVEFSSLHVFSISISAISEPLESNIPLFNNNYSYLPSYSIFHPPLLG